MWRSLLVILTLLVQGCASHGNPSDYPKDWLPLVDGNDACRSLSGNYSLYEARVGGFDDVSRTLLPPYDTAKYKRFDSVSLRFDGEGVLHVAAYHLGEQQLEVIYSIKEGTLSCTREGMWLKNKLSTEKYLHDSEFANAEVNATHLLQDQGGNLIIKIDYSGAGLALFLPTVYSGTRWQRLEIVQPPTLPPRRLAAEQMKAFQRAMSTWSVISGSTAHQMAAVFVDSGVRAKATTFESEDLADQIAEALQSADWEVGRNPVTYHLAFEGTGVGILTSSDTRGIAVGQELAKALNRSGIAATIMPQMRPSCVELGQADVATTGANPRCSQISLFVGDHP